MTNTEEGPAELIITESGALVALLGFANPNLELMFSASIRYDLPVVDAFIEYDVCEKCSIEVIFFF